MNVQFVAPDRVVWSGEAEMVIARTTEGDIGILPRHEPVLGVLADYPVRVKSGDAKEFVAVVHGGFLAVTPDGVSILAESVEFDSDHRA